jgi:hypothetical protein
MRSAAALIVAMVGLPPGAVAGIYTCTDPDGRTVFRDAPCASGEHAGARTQAAEPRTRKREKATEGPLERKQVERLVARLDKALASRDEKAVMALLGRDATVEVVPGPGKPIDPMRADVFRNHLARAFSQPGYVYRAQPARISLSKSKPRATVTRSVRNSWIVDGVVREVDFRERLTVERDGRRLVISKLRKAVPASQNGSFQP